MLVLWQGLHPYSCSRFVTPKQTQTFQGHLPESKAPCSVRREALDGGELQLHTRGFCFQLFEGGRCWGNGKSTWEPPLKQKSNPWSSAVSWDFKSSMWKKIKVIINDKTKCNSYFYLNYTNWPQNITQSKPEIINIIWFNCKLQFGIKNMTLLGNQNLLFFKLTFTFGIRCCYLELKKLVLL